ncbi:MAG: murein biosynthesis integral membrane protein MurJ [Desulfobacterales bacterium]|nr:murein biosynthesis integral membrane protein MurJ [Desulfobacterales bacterium]
MTRTASAVRLLTAITFLSRILGYVRDMLFAGVFGTGLISDAFIAAFRIPNVVRRFFVEGAFSMGFIPVYHTCLQREGPAGARRLAASALQALGLILLGVIAGGLIGSPLIVRGLAPGFAPGSSAYALTLDLMRIMWPYLLFGGLVAMIAGILNAQGHFAAPALAPVGFNLILIAVLLLAMGLELPGRRSALVLAVGVVAGGVAQLLIQVPAVRSRALPLWRPVFPPHAALGAAARMTLPAAAATASFQLNILVGTLLASFLAPGSIAALFFADRLVQFPLGLIAVSGATALMPTLSRLAARAAWHDFNDVFLEALHLVWFVTLPAMVGLLVLRVPIVQVLLERGAFGSNSTRLTSEALLCYGTGLWAYAGLRIVQTALYALQDVRTPLKTAGLGMLVNLLLGAGLMPFMGHRGVALATAVAAVVNLVLLLLALRRRTGTLGGRQGLRALAQAVFCSAAMGLAVAGLRDWIGIDPRAGTVFAVLQLVFCIAAGVGVYMGMAWLCRSRELIALRRIVRPKGF